MHLRLGLCPEFWRGKLAWLPRTLARFEGTASLQRETEQKEERKKGKREIKRNEGKGRKHPRNKFLVTALDRVKVCS